MSSQSSDTAKGDSGEALVKMREAFWQHVLVRHKLIDEDRWKAFIDAYEQFGRHEPIEQWLLNEGVVKAEQVKPLRLAVKNLIWGQILVRNNLITKEQWSEVQKTLKANGSGGSVGKILVEKKMLSKELVDLARKRVSFTLGSFDSSQASAAKPSAAPAKAAADEDVDLVELEEVGGDTEPAPQAAAPAAADSSDDEYSLADGDDLSSDAAHRGDELTWVGDSKSTEDDQESSDWADDMMPQIDQ
ncbi:MAG: hypothetical protein OER86_10420, partial [Phycisphaerae bacterium]|nr:hypothetical protein [Phycisphaerae bacterium]